MSLKPVAEESSNDIYKFKSVETDVVHFILLFTKTYSAYVIGWWGVRCMGYGICSIYIVDVGIVCKDENDKIQSVFCDGYV